LALPKELGLTPVQRMALANSDKSGELDLVGAMAVLADFPTRAAA
jgi:hypothetical protein